MNLPDRPTLLDLLAARMRTWPIERRCAMWAALRGSCRCQRSPGVVAFDTESNCGVVNVCGACDRPLPAKVNND